MFVIVNKDWSIAQLTPSTVYQGSNEASFLGIFAPFSVSSYPAVVINIEKPSGEYIAPLVAFMTPEQPTGFGAWSVALPASVTALPGTVKVSLAFYSSGYTVSEDGQTITGSGVVATTAPIEITVIATVPGILPEEPSADIYAQILENLAALLNRHPDWNQSDDTKPDYIANKPAIKAAAGAGSVVFGGTNNGNAATGTNSAAGGTNSSAAGDNSIVYGEELRSTAPTVLGRYNKDSENDIFQIGSGTAENVRENAVSVSREGTTTFKRAALPNAPTAPTDGANKQYVDERDASLSQALDAGLAQKLNQKNIDPTEFSEDYYKYPNGKAIYGVDNYDNQVLYSLSDRSDSPQNANGVIPLYYEGKLRTKPPIGTEDAVNLSYFRNNAGSAFIYNSTTGVLSLINPAGTVISQVDLPLELIVSGGYYENGVLYLELANGNTIHISVSDLVLPTWIGDIASATGNELNTPPTTAAVKLYVAEAMENAEPPPYVANIPAATGANLSNAPTVQAVKNYVTAQDLAFEQKLKEDLFDAGQLIAYMSIDVNCCGIGAGGAARVENAALQFSSATETKTFTLYGTMYGGDTGGGDAVITLTTTLSALANGQAIKAHVVCRTTHYEGSGEHEGDFTLRNVTRSYFEGYNFDDPSVDEHIYSTYVPNVIFYDQLMLERAKEYTDNAIANAPTSGASLGYVNQTFANAIKGNVSGEGVAMKDDVSAFPHTVTCRVESKNLIPFPYHDTFPKVENGITHTLNSDNSVTVNGTASDNSVFYLQRYFMLPKGTYTLSGAAYGGSVRIAVYKSDWSGGDIAVVGGDSSSTASFTLAEDTEVLIYITVFAGNVVDNVTVYPQIEKGTVATPYAPWVDIGVEVDGAVNGTVTRYGKNLVNYKGATTKFGAIEIDEADDSIIWKSGSDFYIVIPCAIKAGQTVYFSCTSDGQGNNTVGAWALHPVGGGDNDLDGTVNLIADPITASVDIDSIYIYKTNAGTALTADVTISNIQVELGNVATAYEPYVSPVEYAPNTDGEIVGGIPPLAPSMTLMPNLPGVIVNTTYNRDANAVIADLEKKIAALEMAVAT